MSSPAWVTDVVSKASGDAEFKQQLLDDPKTAIAQVTEDDISDLEIEVSEGSDGEINIEVSSDELSDDDLDQISGGGRRPPSQRSS